MNDDGNNTKWEDRFTGEEREIANMDESDLQGVSGFEYSTGSRGDATRYIQQMLIDQSYLAAGQADGVYGPKIEATVRTFQESKGR